MLELKDICKRYVTQSFTQVALDSVSLAFRDNEFVAILGPSGSGKTTMLNVIGGLDHFDSGDLLIDGISTKDFRDRDWDAYRNNRIGFVFQSYNLIPHQTILENVELALTLTGVGHAERRQRAREALEKVGLGEHVNKRPSQLSGGQMQRVAIARAIVNDPEIILADEPTGALDTETSVEVMEILKRLSRDRLVIMVTHNPQLAEEYSDRIVRIRDGEVTSDSRPVDAEAESLTPEQIQEHAVADARKGKRGMSYLSAIQLSFNNLMTKKGRTFLTAFAGSIGIIGIALILSLSDGAQNYIAETEETTMGSYPLTIQKTAVDMASMMSAMMGTGDTKGEAPKGTAESKNIVTDMVESIGGGATENDMKAIKQWLETNPGDINDLVTDIQYNYSTPLNVFKDDTSAGAVQVNPATVMNALGISTSGSTQTQLMSSMASTGQGYDVWSELLSSKKAVDRDWKLVDGRMPQAWNEVVIALDEHGRISDYTLYALGMLDQSDLKGMMRNVLAGKKVEGAKETSYSYDELMKLVFRLVPESSKYQKQADGTWKDMSEDAAFMKSAVAAGEQVHVVGVVRATGDAGATVARYGGVLYPASLMKHMVETVAASDVVAAQKADPGTDIFTGYPFSDTASATMSLDEIESMIGMMGGEQATQAQAYIDQMRAQGSSDEEIAAAFSKLMSSQTDDATYDGNLEKLGAASLDDPSVIQIYPVDFKAKEQIDTLIDDYNKDIKAAGEGSEIQYTDIVGTLMSSVTSIVNSLTYILIAFVAISLVVSSIMIGIITYISVLERTKEIGILRAIGASKRDVSRIFTAETFITGLVSGLLGVGITVLLDFPVNWIIEAVAGVRNLAAVPAGAGAVLVLISVALALAAGLAPSRMAAKKDPVTALRTE